MCCVAATIAAAAGAAVAATAEQPPHAFLRRVPERECNLAIADVAAAPVQLVLHLVMMELPLALVLLNLDDEVFY